MQSHKQKKNICHPCNKTNKAGLEVKRRTELYTGIRLTHQKHGSYKWHHPRQKQIDSHPLTTYEPGENQETNHKRAFRSKLSENKIK